MADDPQNWLIEYDIRQQDNSIVTMKVPYTISWKRYVSWVQSYEQAQASYG